MDYLHGEVNSPPGSEREVPVPGENSGSPEGAMATKLGVTPGMVVSEMGWDDDCDEALRAAVEDLAGAPIVGDDHDDVIDLVMLWYRDGDGDLVDVLMDCIGPLDEHGIIWLFTPKPGRVGHVEPEDIADAAPTAGLMDTSSVSASREWQGTRLVAPHTKKR